MEQLGAAIVLGLVFGSAYALIALGIVLVYKGSRVFNFAQGEVATVAAFTTLMLLDNMPYVLALLVGVLAGVLMGLAVEVTIVRALFNAPRVTLLVATAAVALGAISLELLFGDAQPRFYPPLVEGVAWRVFGVAITWQQLLVVAALAALGFLLYLFFSRTDLGLAVLAASQDPTATNLVGVSARRISSLVWGMAAFLAAVAGTLVAPDASGSFTPGYFTSQFLIFSFVAAVVGGMTSLPGAVIGGLVLGLVQSFTTEFVADLSWVSENLPGTGQISVFLLLVIVLAVRPTGLLGKEA
jgi:branched-chain amino acid transport system permease protein